MSKPRSREDFLESMARRHLDGSPFPRMADVLQPGSSGNVTVRISDLKSSHLIMNNLRAMRDGHPERLCCPGRFAVMVVDHQVMMSDTPMERCTNMEFYQAARGRVLVGGLGLGMVVHALNAKKEVEHITVVEINEHVIKLIAPTLPKNIEVVHADVEQFVETARQQKPTPKWDTIFFDIWPTISTDDGPQISRLHRRSRKLLNPGGWMNSWAAEIRRQMKREERRW